MSQANIQAPIHVDASHPGVCHILTSGTARERLFAPEGGGDAGGGGGGSAPAAAAPAAPASEPAKAPAEGKTAPAPEKPAKDRADGLPEPRTRAEVKKSAAKELSDMLKERRRVEAAEDGDDDGDAPPAKPKGDKANGEERPESQRERGSDGKFAPKAAEQPPKAEPTKQQQAQQQPPQQDRGETDAKLSRTIRELNSATAERETARRELAQIKRELEERKAREESYKKNPLDALQDLGWDLDRVAREVVENGMRPSQRAQLPEDVKRELEASRQFRERWEAQERQREEQAQQAARKAERERDVGNVGAFLKTNADAYPFAAALEWAAGAIVDQALPLDKRGSGAQADAFRHLVAFEQSMADTFGGLMGNERALSKALASKPELGKSLVAQLRKLGLIGEGKEAKSPASNGGDDDDSDGPSSVSSVPSTRSAAPKTRGEQKRAAVGAFKEWRRQHQEADDE